jgi:hypothetical protein
MTETSRKFTEKRILTPKQEDAACSMALGKTIEAAAQQCNVSSRTVKSWLSRIPDFKRRIVTLRAEATDRTLSILTSFSAQAAEKLASLLNSSNERVAGWAAVKLLELRYSYSTDVDHEERLAALEAEQDAKPKTYRPRGVV